MAAYLPHSQPIEAIYHKEVGNSSRVKGKGGTKERGHTLLGIVPDLTLTEKPLFAEGGIIILRMVINYSDKLLV